MDHFIPQSTDLDDIGRGRHPLHGKRGTFLEVAGRNGVDRNFIWQNRGDRIVRGSERAGIKAKDFGAEALWSNDSTSPRVEIPRVVIETMQIDIRTLNAQDVAVFWRLFAEARHQGIQHGRHVIDIQAIKGYLNNTRRSRILSSFDKLTGVEMSLRLNQAGAHGRVGMPMLESFEVVGDTVYFTLPSVLRSAVLFSRDYAWIDINAIPRFASKFTASVYLKLCYEAGKHRTRRANVADSLDAFRARMHLPEGTKANVLADVISRVKDDLLAIDGPRRRFNVKFVVESGEYGVVKIDVTSAAKKLAELKPQGLSAPARRQLAQNNTGILAVPATRYPALVRIRQAATHLGTAALHVADAWKMAVNGAMRDETKTVVGLRGSDFLGLVDRYGADDVFEFWIDKQSVPGLGVRAIEDIGMPVYRQRAVAVIDIPDVVEEMVEDDVTMAADYDHVEYGEVEVPPTAMANDDIDDCDIPY